MSKLNPVTIKRLREIKAQILAEPRQFQMDSYFTDSLESGKNIPNCGTAACIAGWAISRALIKNPAEAAASGYGLHREIVASKYLLLTEARSKRLYHQSRWPQKFQKLDESHEGTHRFAKQAAARIDHFIRTQGAE